MTPSASRPSRGSTGGHNSHETYSMEPFRRRRYQRQCLLMNLRHRWASGLMVPGIGLTAGQPEVIRQAAGVTAYRAPDGSVLTAFWLLLQAGALARWQGHRLKASFPRREGASIGAAMPDFRALVWIGVPPMAAGRRSHLRPERLFAWRGWKRSGRRCDLRPARKRFQSTLTCGLGCLSWRLGEGAAGHHRFKRSPRRSTSRKIARSWRSSVHDSCSFIHENKPFPLIMDSR